MPVMRGGMGCYFPGTSRPCIHAVCVYMHVCVRLYFELLIFEKLVAQCA